MGIAVPAIWGCCARNLGNSPDSSRRPQFYPDPASTHTLDPQFGEGSDMKAKLKTALLTAMVAGALPLAAGATDNDGHDRHHSSYYSPIVNAVREVVLNFTREEVKKYGLIARTPCV